MNNLLDGNRRDFLKKMLTATVFTAVLPRTILGQIEPTETSSLNSAFIKYPISLTQYPDLRNLWGSVVLSVGKDPKGVFISLVITHIPKHIYGAEFAAVDQKCPHMGYSVPKYIKQYGTIVCPHQRSTFDAVGTYISGPAQDKFGNGWNLQRYDTEYKDGDDTVFVLWKNPYAITQITEGQNPDIYLSDCSPNPSSSSVHFDYSLEKPAHIDISIWNSNGDKVSTIIKDNLPAGHFNFDLDVSSLTTGEYTVIMISNEGSKTSRKIIVTR
jgi:Rieske Fe-S protein